ncbi:hypothetical protein BXY85_1426 [Roseivirga pacifica]|uniref:Protein NO VEIN C-terminal domain-containing protein n=1 Tax=Roseivirga pacifica TaxID=1267423 RepID=A0A1I0MHL0_9BACT|nr:hypothetical protein [Roseivirga pacifica]RKQ50411.1 hypothetical protein BXY85_1426 [Roseivirga pacifica]SEV87853.1 hypothetical protein SAMN05216290_0410 [Roseivirga pacifica]
MSREHSFKLTISNNATEKEGINYLIKQHTGFFKIDKEMKKVLLDKVSQPYRFLQSFDVVYIPRLKGIEFKEQHIETHLDELLFIELKTTKKFLPENPKGFFFGATENEFDFGQALGDKFRFCFVCLNPESLSYKLLTLEELDKIIKNKRIQFQINL